MNWESLKKYLAVGFIYVLLTAFIAAYRYARLDRFSLELVSATIGAAGIVAVGLFLLSKSLRHIIPQRNAWQETIGVLGTVGIASSLLTIRSPQVVGVAALLLIFLVFYSKHLLQTSPPGLAQNLKNLLAVMTLLVLLFFQIIERFISLRDWFALILNPNNAIQGSILPPLTLLLILYIMIILIIYLWQFFTEPSEATPVKTPPPTPVVPAPPIPQSPAKPAPSKPPGPPSTAHVPQNAPPNTGQNRVM